MHLQHCQHKRAPDSYDALLSKKNTEALLDSLFESSSACGGPPLPNIHSIIKFDVEQFAKFVNVKKFKSLQ